MVTGSVGGVPVAGDLEEAERVVRGMANGGLRREDDEVMNALDTLLAEFDRRAQEIKLLEGVRNNLVRAGDMENKRATAERHQADLRLLHADAERKELEADRAALSSLLRGMARRVGTLRGNGRHITAIVEDMQHRLDTALNERDDLQTQLAELDRLRRNHDALADAYIGAREELDNARTNAREAIGNRDSNVNRLLGQVAAVRALADDLHNSLFRVDGAIQWAHVESLVSRIRATLDGSTDTSESLKSSDTVSDSNRPVSPREDETPEPATAKVCSKCGTTACVEDAESGWYDLPEIADVPAGSVSTTPDLPELADAARTVLAEWARMHPSGRLAMYTAMDALRRAVTGVEPAADPALIGTYADPEFRAHQDHKHPVAGCGYCPDEEASDG